LKIMAKLVYGGVGAEVHIAFKAPKRCRLISYSTPSKSCFLNVKKSPPPPPLFLQ
jgi:hypothetical protein